MFLLLNKDVVWAEFDVVTTSGFESIKITRENRNLIYPWIKDIASFILNRRAPKHRAHIRELLKQCGCDTLQGYLDISHALSLNDTIWVKRSNDKITWDSVSLYRHPFNTVIAKAAFSGGLFGNKFSTTSPEFGTDGTFAKCWVREGGKIKLVKRGSEGFSNSGLEPYSEFYASQILREFGARSVSYGLTMYSGKLASKCELFTSEDYGLVPFSALTSTGDIGALADWYDKHGLIHQFAEMIIADALILNQDRHLGNFGFLFETATGKIVGTAPLYDHNISLLCYASDADLESSSSLDNYFSRVNFGPKLYDDFIGTAKRLMTPDLRKRLVRLKGVKLKKHSRYNLPDWRIACLNYVINNQIRLLLK